MQILYGVVGEGMGHATRSRVVIEHLHAQGHRIWVIASGPAYRFLADAFATRHNVHVEAIAGLRLAYRDNQLQLGKSLSDNAAMAPASLLRNSLAYWRLRRRRNFAPNIVLSDFDSWAWAFAVVHGLPLISIDNMQILNRCHHDADVTNDRCAEFRLAKASVKAKLPGAHHYVITSFFAPEVRKDRTTLVPPILRREVQEARRTLGRHVVVYQRAVSDEVLAQALARCAHEFRVYGSDRRGTCGNVTYLPFSNDGFVRDLASARAVIAGGGFSLMSEAVNLAVPMLAVPIAGQYEQVLNARYLQKLGFGATANTMTAEVLRAFLSNLDSYAAALAQRRPESTTHALATIDRVLAATCANSLAA